MNPNASPESSQQNQTTLHPNLQLALSSLNVDLEEEINRFRQSQQPQSEIANTSPESPSNSSSTVSSASLTYGNSASTPVSQTEENIDAELIQDYLASSEELLRGVNETEDATTQDSTTSESPQDKNATSWRHYLFTPLGVAGILIFLLSGTLLSMMMINLGQTRLSNSASSNSQSKGQTSQTASQPPESNATDESSSQIPNRPNLANDEFIELDTDNLVEAEPAEEVSSQVKPSCDGNFYCVMIENPTQTEYRKTRRLVGDAYLREFPNVGQVLQVGAFDTQSQAEQLQQRLEQQGLSATIYQPE